VPADHDQRYDFFLSRRGAVAAVAREVADVLTERDYKVLVQDYDIPIGASFVEAMHEAVKNSRDLVILYTREYEQSPYTRKEFTSFEAERAQSMEERHVIVLRCEDVPLRGLLADNVYQDLVGITDPEERKRRIIAAAEHQSQAAPPPPRPFIGVPPRIASFTGRAEELEKLDAILMRDKPAAVTQSVGRAAVQGLGGVGKTSLATEYAHRYRQLYAGVCWCPAETRAGLLTSLAELALTLGAATADEADVQKAAKAALRRLGEQRAAWLLVYDNLTSPEEITDLMPAGGARLLITSRFSDWSAWADELPLDMLPLREAIAFVQNRTAREDADGAQKLAEALGCLPLALDHAAAYCKRTQTRFVEYAAQASSLIANVPRGTAYPRSIAATFDLAITAASSQCPEAETLIACLGNCAPERIPMMLIQGAMGGTERQAIGVLTEMSLVKPDAFEDGTPAVTVHRLVQAAGRSRSEKNGLAQNAIEWTIDWFMLMYPSGAFGDPQWWPLCAQLTPHLLSHRRLDSRVTQKHSKWPELLNRVGGYLHGRALYSEAEEIFSDVLDLCERTRGPDHLDTAGILNDLALLLKARNDLSKARLFYERALAIRQQKLGLKHPEVALSLNNLAMLLLVSEADRDFAQAQQLVERALSICETRLGDEHPYTAESLNNLATVLRRQGQRSAARVLYERALAVREKVLGSENLATAQTLNSLAMLLMDEGDLVAAKPLLQRALHIHEKTLGSEHPITATNLINLGALLAGERNFIDAHLLFTRALAIREKTLGPHHPNTTRTVRHLADALDALGRTEKASAMREKYGITTEAPSAS
jgi:tetratricopeptide (TPR) repeat protein